MSSHYYLRREDRTQELNQRHQVVKVAKRAHLRDRLTRDFLTRYPVDSSIPLEQQAQIEKTVSQEIDKMLLKSSSVNKLTLAALEKELAEKFNLKYEKRPSVQASPNLRLSVARNKSQEHLDRAGGVQLPDIASKRFGAKQSNSVLAHAGSMATI